MNEFSQGYIYTLVFLAFGICVVIVAIASAHETLKEGRREERRQIKQRVKRILANFSKGKQR